MKLQIARALGIAAAALALATTAQAQGRGHGKGHGEEHGRAHGQTRGHDDGDVMPGYRRVPPGLAKKPGQMPPGQYKKLYPAQGATVLDEVLRRHGYIVNRIVPVGTSRYVYYRAPNGAWQRAVVSPGTTRLSFGNVPAGLLQEILSLLY
ncbi:MAG TPA: hypothetical protein VHB25_19985 [Gemmatimonadaceae bacterium]|nr:hypothetical protein [Gemmatimonadaceae bacterium]